MIHKYKFNWYVINYLNILFNLYVNIKKKKVFLKVRDAFVNLKKYYANNSSSVKK